MRWPSLNSVFFVSLAGCLWVLMLAAGSGRATHCGTPFEYTTTLEGGELAVTDLPYDWWSDAGDDDLRLEVWTRPRRGGGLIGPLWVQRGVRVTITSRDFAVRTAIDRPRHVATLRSARPELAAVYDGLVEHLGSSGEGPLLLAGNGMRFGAWWPDVGGWLTHLAALGVIGPITCWIAMGLRRVARDSAARRLQRFGPACTCCGYPVTGLPSPVCPECGTGFGQIVDPETRAVA